MSILICVAFCSGQRGPLRRVQNRCSSDFFGQDAMERKRQSISEQGFHNYMLIVMCLDNMKRLCQKNVCSVQAKHAIECKALTLLTGTRWKAIEAVCFQHNNSNSSISPNILNPSVCTIIPTTLPTTSTF